MFFDRSLTNSSAKMRLRASVSAASMILAGAAFANPTNPTVVTGDVAISGLGTSDVLVVNDSMRSVVNWESFSIGTGESTTFDQITNDAAILNRVTGGDISEIYGTLSSNGQVFLINESGILIGESGLVDTNGFVASTLNIADEDFLAGGDIVFRQGVEVGGGITVEGKIRSVSGGDIFLLSREIDITTTAEIESQGGTVGLAAGEEILLRPVDTGQGRISIRAGSGRINNAGSVEAAVAELKAAGGNEYALAINNTGIVRAKSYSTSGGRVTLGGGGTVRNSGTVKATRTVRVRSAQKVVNSGNVEAKGGDIVFEAPQIVVEAGSLLDVSAAMGGGRVFVGGGYQGGNTDWDGNDIDIENALSVVFEAGAKIDASATLSDAGDVVIWADGSTTSLGDINASTLSGKGGDVEISGKEELTVNGFVDRRGPGGDGVLLLDPTNITIVDGIAAASTANVVTDGFINQQLGLGSVTITTAIGGADAGDITFDTSAGDIDVFNDAGGAARTLHFEAESNITTTGTGDITILLTSTGSATGPVQANTAGGVALRAAGNITIGNLGAAGQDITIGSEFGYTQVIAGDSDFDGVTDQAGAVTVAGNGGYTQIGFNFDALSANSFGGGALVRNAVGRAFGSGLLEAANGDITVSGSEVIVRSDTVQNSGAQIGHGGRVVNLDDTSGYSIANSNIDVFATNAVSVIASGDTFSQIGHGAFTTDTLTGGSDGLSTGDISGDITLTTTNSNISITTNQSIQDAGNPVVQSARIGHGATALFDGEPAAGTEYAFGRIAGDVTLDAQRVIMGGNQTLDQAPNYSVSKFTQIGHGNMVLGDISTSVAVGQDLNIDANTIGNFYDVAGAQAGSDISVTTARGADIGGTITDNNDNDDVLIAQRIGHGNNFGVTSSVASGAGVRIEEQYISGDIALVQTDATLAPGEALNIKADINTGNQAQSSTVVYSVVGHGSQILASTGQGDAASAGDGGDFFYQEAQIIGASVYVETQTAGSDTAGENSIFVEATVNTGLASVTDVNAFAQIGHATMLSVSTGSGGAAADLDGGDGGDVQINRGSVWDGRQLFNQGVVGEYQIGNGLPNGTAITVDSANQVIVDSQVVTGTGGITEGGAQAQIGVGGFYGVNTGLGGSDANGFDGGNGGDILVTQSTFGAMYGVVDAMSGNVVVTDTAQGIHTDIDIIADETSADRNLEVNSLVSVGLGNANEGHMASTIGHGDEFRLVTGYGGNAGDPTTNIEDSADGGNGGSIDVSMATTEIQGQIFVDVAAGLLVESRASNSATASQNFNLVTSVIGHGGFTFANTGFGGNSNGTVSQSLNSVSGGQGGDILLNLPSINNRIGSGLTPGGGVNLAGDDLEYEGSDINIVIASEATTPFVETIIIRSQIPDALAQGQGSDIESKVGHLSRSVAVAGVGGNSLTGDAPMDGLRGDTHANGGRGGNVVIAEGHARGDISIGETIANALKQIFMLSNASGDTDSTANATIGHTNRVSGFGQNGGDGGDFDNLGTVSIQNSDFADHVTFLDLTVDGMGDPARDDKFNLAGVTDPLSTLGDDGIDIDFQTLIPAIGGMAGAAPEADGVPETFASLVAHIGDGSGLTDNMDGADQGVILFDDNGDPSYILDDMGNFVENNSANFNTYIQLGVGSSQSDNAAFFGQTIVGSFEQNTGMGQAHAYDRVMGVDVDHDGSIDFVDFDGDGQLDIVDVDTDGQYDMVDSRRARQGAGNGLDLLDYTGFTGEAFDINHVNGGWDLSDFNQANGGDGGNVLIASSFIEGDVDLDIGQDTMSDAASLFVQSVQFDGVGGGGEEVAVSRVGHSQISHGSTSGDIGWSLAGTGLNSANAANGGAAGELATMANGGDGGSVTIVQGGAIAIDPATGQPAISAAAMGMPWDVEIVSIIGDTFIDAENKVRLQSNMTDGIGSGIESTIGHGAIVLANADNTGGSGESVGLTGAESTGGSTTELADGGVGGTSSITQHAQAGEITLLVGDDHNAGQDFSVELSSKTFYTATAGGNSDSSIVTQIGHSFAAVGFSGTGGEGDDGQLAGSGGDGGAVNIVQEDIVNADVVIDTISKGGNGVQIETDLTHSARSVLLARVGHTNEIFASTGAGGAGAQTSTVTEQRNQVAMGGNGGDITVHQGVNASDIFVETGANTVGDNAVEILAIARSGTPYSHTDDLVAAGIGHLGTGEYFTGTGGEGGDEDGNSSVGNSIDPNQRLAGDADLDTTDNWQGAGSRLTLGTVRDAGRGGHIDVTNNATFDTSFGGGVSNVITFHGAAANITVQTFDTTAGVNDGILVHAQSGMGDNHASALEQTIGSIGHIQLDEALARDGGSALIGPDPVDSTSIDGGDGGNALVTQGAMTGNIVVTNMATNLAYADMNPAVAGANTSTLAADQEDIRVFSTGTNLFDSSNHRADARIGHFADGDVTSGNGGSGVQPKGTPSLGTYGFVSALAGYGGDAELNVASMEGNISVQAENSVEVVAQHVSQSGAFNVALIGHASAGEVISGEGATGGEGATQNLYFIYEALLEYDSYRQDGDDHATAWSKLTMLEQQLIDAIVNKYYEQDGTQSGYAAEKDIQPFLDKLVQGARDNDITNANLDGNADGASTLTDEEIETLQNLIGASGDGGDARFTSGAINGAVTVRAEARDTTDATRGVLVNAEDAVLTSAAQVAQIGHHTEIRQVRAGDAGDVIAYADQMGGDGGSIYVTQNSLSGDLSVTTPHLIHVHANDSGLGASDGTNARVGHRMTVGSDRISYREPVILRAGDGGAETSVLSDGYNGNGGDVTVTQNTITGAFNIASTRAEADEDGILLETTGGGSAGDIEVHIGHDMNIDDIQSGNAGQRIGIHGPNGLNEGVLEGNGGDIVVTQGAIEENITLETTGSELQLTINSESTADTARILVGHEREIGERGEGGQVIAGFGGDSIAEDSNTSSLATMDGVQDADGGTITVTTGVLGGAVTLRSTAEDVRLEILGGSGGADDDIEIGHVQTADLISGDGGRYRGTTPATAGDGGDIQLDFGAIRGNTLLHADSTNTGGGHRVLTSVNTFGGSESIRVGHRNLITAESGRSGFGEGFAIADLETLLADYVALDEFGDGAGDTPADRREEITLGMANEILQIMENSADAARFAFDTIQERLTPADRATFLAALELIENAVALRQVDMAADDPAIMQSSAGLIATQLGIIRNVLGADQDLLSDPSNSGFIQYAQPVRIDAAVAQIANATDGIIEVSGGGVTGGNAAIQFGHSSTIGNTTGIAGGETDGGAPSGGVAGNGGNILVSQDVRGAISASADLIAVEGANSAGNLGLTFGHWAGLENFGGQSDIGSKVANGGAVQASQSVTSAHITLNANHYSNDDAAENSILGLGGAGSATLRIGNFGQSESRSDADNSNEVTTTEANRGGLVDTFQQVRANLVISTDLDANNVYNDLTIEAGGNGAQTVLISNEGYLLGNSGADNEDGGDVEVTQAVSGDININRVEDLTVQTFGSGAHGVQIGHDGTLTAISGRVNNPTDSGFGGYVEAVQTVGGLLNVGAARHLQVGNTTSAAGADLTIGHDGDLTARTAGDTEEPNARNVDLDAEQTVGADITLSAATVHVESSGAAHATRIGNQVERVLEADDVESHIGGAGAGLDTLGTSTSTVIGDVVIAGTGVYAQAETDTTVPSAGVPTTAVRLSSEMGALDIGHSSVSTVNGTSPVADGSAMTNQEITGAVSITSVSDAVISSETGGSLRTGHLIVELGDLTTNPLVVAGPGMVESRLFQTITETATITVTAQQSMEIAAAAGTINIGSTSPEANRSQEDGANIITVQTIMGDIAVQAGLAGNGTADGMFAPNSDDLSITSGPPLDVRIGHDHADANTGPANNTTQTVDADILVTAGADLEVIDSAIGHAHYDFDDVAPDTANSTVNSAGRNRIAGLTTIGAVQSVTSEGGDGGVASAMLFDGAKINSGYSDVGGQLRFFTPSRENVDISGATQFNDHGTGDEAQTRPGGGTENLFLADGGNDHEEPFQLLSTSASYTAAKAGLGNFTFYFTNPVEETGFLPPDVEIPLFINTFDLPQVELVFAPDGSLQSVMNIGALDGFIGTSSVELLCEALGVSPEDCTRLQQFIGQNQLLPGTQDANGGDDDDGFDVSALPAPVPPPVTFSVGEETQDVAVASVELPEDDQIADGQPDDEPNSNGLRLLTFAEIGQRITQLFTGAATRLGG